MEESKEEILEKIKSLKKQLEDLNSQIIDFDLPKNYNQMSDEEKKAYQQKQDMLKKQALSDIENYSVIINDYTMVKYPEKRSIVPIFIRDVGSLSALPIERGTFTKTIPDKYKEQHKKDLEEIEKLIERYNSTKAIRNDRIEFGVNFNNFIQTYFNKQASDTIDAISNKRFLEKYDKTQDKNGNVIGDKFKFQNLTDEQRKDLIKIRINVFAEKLDRLEIVAEKKVRNDTKQKMETFLDKYFMPNTDVPFRNGIKKFTSVKSVVSNSGIDMSKNNINNIRKKSKIMTNVTVEEDREEKNKSRMIELGVMRDKFEKFVRDYKGNGRQFSIEFENNFPEIAQKLYKQKSGNDMLSFRSQNLASSPISVQEHEIEKQFDEELRKVNYRLRYIAKFIPASVSTSSAFLGKQLTNAKTQTEKKLDQMKVKEYEKELKNINLKEDLIGYESILESVNKPLQTEFLEYTNKNVKKFDKLSEISKKNELKKYISLKIDKLNETVHKNKFFSLGTEKIAKLNGVLIDRSEKMTTKEMKNVLDTLSPEQADYYKHLLQTIKEYTNKYNSEKLTIDKLSEQLENLTNKLYSYENNKQINKIMSDINAHNKKMSLVKSSLDAALQRKLTFENNYATKQISEAISSGAGKAVAYNTAVSVLDKYDFPALDAFGEKYIIQKGTLEGKQIEKIVSAFVMDFKNQVQNMKVAFSGTNYTEINDYISRLESRLEDDFGSTIRDLKKTQKFFNSELETCKKSENKELADELEKFIARLDKGEVNLIRKLKSMNIEIGDVTLKKTKK